MSKNNTKLSPEEWQRRKGDGGSMGRTLRSREKLVHVSQWYQPVMKDVVGEDGSVVGQELDKYEAQYKDITGKLDKGRSYNNDIRVDGHRIRHFIGRRRLARHVAAIGEE